MASNLLSCLESRGCGLGYIMRRCDCGSGVRELEGPNDVALHLAKLLSKGHATDERRLTRDR